MNRFQSNASTSRSLSTCSLSKWTIQLLESCYDLCLLVFIKVQWDKKPQLHSRTWKHWSTCFDKLQICDKRGLKNCTYLEMRTFCVFLMNTTFRDKVLGYRSFLYWLHSTFLQQHLKTIVLYTVVPILRLDSNRQNAWVNSRKKIVAKIFFVDTIMPWYNLVDSKFGKKSNCW